MGSISKGYRRCTSTLADRQLGIVWCQLGRRHTGPHEYRLTIHWSDAEAGPHEPSRFDVRQEQA